MKNKKILILNKYGTKGASSRVRFLQYLPYITGNGIETTIEEFISNKALELRYQKGKYSIKDILKSYYHRIRILLSKRKFNLIYIEKEALPWAPLSLELALLHGAPYMLDYDDAIFHNYENHKYSVVRHLYGKRLDGLMSRAQLVVCGNQYLAERAREAGATWVEVLPTVIDLMRYQYPHPAQAERTSKSPTVVWIGSPSTLHYLKLLQAPLQRLAQRLFFVLRVIGGEFSLPGVQVECIPWSDDTEVANIAAADVGVMPLLDSPWERGKCGYKLIQYMACGLPVVASPVGVNNTIVEDGVNGFLAKNTHDWVNFLEELLTNENMRKKMGSAGRLRVEQEYCLQVTGPRLASWLNKITKKVE